MSNNSNCSNKSEYSNNNYYINNSNNMSNNSNTFSNHMNSTVTESPILRISEVIQSTNKTFTHRYGLIIILLFW